MIHTFKAVGQPMMLDVGSGAVHAIDETAYDVLSLWNDHTPEEIVQTLSDALQPGGAGGSGGRAAPTGGVGGPECSG